MASKYYKLIDPIDHLRHMFEEVQVIDHFAKLHSEDCEIDKLKPYKPSYFLYTFFLFNALYNVDWEKSFESNDLILYERARQKGKKYIDEKKKVSNLISFCFSENTFIKNNNYKEEFLSQLMKYKNNLEIILKGIREDRKPNGNFYTEKQKQSIIDYKRHICLLIKEKKFKKEIIIKIVDFIYLVRCNIFHGIKSFKDLSSPDQGERLLFYKDILIAVNKMVLDKADYLLQLPYEEEEELEEEDQ